MKQNPNLAFLHVSEHLKTPEMCNKAVEATGENLQHVPKDKISKELCQKAVRTFGKSLEFVPRLHYDTAMCTLAVQQDGTNLKFVPDNLKSKKLCVLAQENSTQDLKEFLPKKFAVVEKATPSAALQAVHNMTSMREQTQKQAQKQTLKVA
jgi:hypothetical protein